MAAASAVVDACSLSRSHQDREVVALSNVTTLPLNLFNCSSLGVNQVRLQHLEVFIRCHACRFSSPSLQELRTEEEEMRQSAASLQSMSEVCLLLLPRAFRSCARNGSARGSTSTVRRNGLQEYCLPAAD